MAFLSKSVLVRLGLVGLAVVAASGCSLVRDDRYGALNVKIAWPEETRVIPSYAKSARVILQGSNGGFGNNYNDRFQIISRGTSNAHEDEVRFDQIIRRFDEDLPFIDHFVEVIFYSGSGGTGAVVASAQYSFRFRDYNWTHNFDVSPYVQSEIANLRFDGPFTVSLTGGPRTLLANGVDRFGRTIALPQRALLWEKVAGDAGDVTLEGVFTPTTTGSVQLRVTEVDGQVDPLITSITVTP
ncbi:MAG: hypothetical protein KF812_08925 [Fimbriimonadaceae bacterium]|nr:hypothetical protein [Fimbriimonadaceae bacterium]